MQRPVNERFEVGISRWKLAVITIICCTAAFSMAVTQFTIDRVTGHGSVLFVIVAGVSISAAFASVWLRRRPICVIDDKGIMDYGFFSQGFGLIGWDNVEGVIKRPGKYGVSLLVKVNNYNELVSRRNKLMQPLLLLAGRFFGGWILLPIAWSNTDAETVRQQIYHYSKNRF